MADFLIISVEGRTGFLPFILWEQSKALSKASTCSYGSVCSEGRDWMSSCVPGIWRHGTCTTPLCGFEVLSNLSLPGEGIHLTYLWGFLLICLCGFFFPLISKLCHFSSQQGYSSILNSESWEMKQTMTTYIKSPANPVYSCMWGVCVNALSYERHIKAS